MSNLESICRWIASFPGWEGDAPVLDCLGVAPGSSGLFYEGLTRGKRLGDVAGNEAISCRYQFTLRRVMPRIETAPQWVAEFEHWVLRESLLGRTPVREHSNAPCDIRAEKGKLDAARQTGTGVYTVKLSVEYTLRQQ